MRDLKHVYEAVGAQLAETDGRGALNAVRGAGGGLTVEEASRRLQKIRHEVDAYGERVRREIVAPACRRFELQYTSGMGVFYFSPVGDDGRVTWSDRQAVESDEGLSDAAKAVLGPILDLLNTSVLMRDDMLGFFVGDAP